MKPLSRTIFATAVAISVAISLTPSPAAGAEENFFQKFVLTEPMNWSGFYIGFNNGATFNNFHAGKHTTDVDIEEQFYELEPQVTGDDSVFATFHTPGHRKNDTETIGGGQTGFNFQFGRFVVGGEGSFIGNGTETSGRFHDFQENQLFFTMWRPQLPLQMGGVTAETEFSSMRKVETTWNGFVGGHVGFAWNRFLFYGEGGAAFTDVHFESTDKADTSFFENRCDCPGLIPSSAVQPQLDDGGVFIGEIVSKKTHTQGNVLTGWYGGGGIDFALTKIVSIGVGYKHVDWGDVTEHQMEGGTPVFPSNSKLDLTGDQVVFKVNLLIGH